MQKHTASRKLFNDDLDSDLSSKSVIFISSDESGEVSDEWDSDCSTETERLIERIERDFHASPIINGGRIMIVEKDEDEQGPSTRGPGVSVTPKLGLEHSNEELCFAPKKENALQRLQLCKTILPVAETPWSLPHKRGAHRVKPH